MKKPTKQFTRYGLIALSAILVSCAGVQQDGRFTRSQNKGSGNKAGKTSGSKQGAGDKEDASATKSYLAKSDEIAFELSAVTPENVGASVSEIKDQSFTQALKAQYKRGESGPWMAVLKTEDVRGIKAGSQIIAHFYARSVAPFNNDRDAAIGFYVYREKPWVQVASNRIIADDQWREYTIIFSPDQDFFDNELNLAFDFGLKKQAVEVANIRMTDVVNSSDDQAPIAATSSSTYAGRSSKAAWRKAADARIKQHRMGRLNLSVLDEKGQPLPGAKVKYRLEKHAFGFGTAVNKRLIAHRDTPDHQLYAAKVKDLFNKAVLENGMKWNQWESEIAPFLKEDTLKSIDWLEAQGIAIRGNVLVWPGWDKQNPTDLRKLDKAQLAKRIDAHIRDIAGTLKGRIVEWDVVNESRTNKDFTKVLGDQALADWFKLARQVDPAAKLYHNDFGILNGSDTAAETLEKTVAQIRQGGGQIDGLGLQAHFDYYLPSPERMIEVLDRLGKLGLDIQATEFDVNVDDEQTQADFTRDFLTVMFSHPSVTGVTFWGFWEGQHWKPSCALFRKDWSVKPNGQAYLDLVKTQWNTVGSGKTDGKGVLGFEGYQGRYEVTVTHGGKTHTQTVELGKGTSAQFLQFGKKPAPAKTVAKPVAKPSTVKPAPRVTRPAPKVARPAPAKVTPVPVKPLPKVTPKPVPVPKVTPAVPKTTPKALPRPVPAIPKVPPVTPRTIPAPKAPSAPKTTPAVPKVTPAVPKVTPAVPKVTPAAPKVIPVRPKTAPTLPRPSIPAPSARPQLPALPTPSGVKKVPSIPKAKPSPGVPATPTRTLPKPLIKSPSAKIKPTPIPAKPSVTSPVPAAPKVLPKTIPAPKAPAVSKPAPAVPPKGLPAPPTGGADAEAKERMTKLRERLRAAKERLAEKTKASEAAEEK